MKKQRKTTAKHNRARPSAIRGRSVQRAPQARRSAIALFRDCLLDLTRGGVFPRGTRAQAAVYSGDEREALALLMLPFLLMTAAISINQSVRRVAPTPEIAIALPASPAKPAAARQGALTEAYRWLTRANVTAYAPPLPFAKREVQLALRPIEAKDADARPMSAIPPATASGDTQTPAAIGVAAAALHAEISAAQPAPGVIAELALPRDIARAPNERHAGLELESHVPIPAPAVPVTGEASRASLDYSAEAAAEFIAGGHGAPAANICQLSAARFAMPVSLNRSGVAAASDSAAFGRGLATAARAQIDDLVVYTDRYRRLAYPLGDVASLYGVCTDVVIRAYRAMGVDLQQLVHETRSGSGDTSIEHRRVETLRRFFAKHGQQLPPSEFGEDYKPGDVVTYYRPQNRHSHTHIAIVADEIGPSGNPMIIHNRGWGPQIEDGLFVDQITGHYRFSGLKNAAPPSINVTGTPKSNSVGHPEQCSLVNGAATRKCKQRARIAATAATGMAR